MQDMKFNTPVLPKTKMPEGQIKTKKPFFSKKIILFTVILIVILFSPFIAGRVKEKFFGADISDSAVSSDYYAVFLDNNQVYFGKVVSKSNEEMTLTDVYYIQAAGASISPTSSDINRERFTLIKLGQELHGPTEEMMINMEHVVFYEKLKEDSKVVESIKNQKQ